MALIEMEPRSPGSRGGRPGGVLVAVALVAIAAGIGFWFGRRAPDKAPAPTAATTAAPVASAAPAQAGAPAAGSPAAAPVPGAAPSAQGAAVAPVAAPATTVATPAPAEATGPRLVSAVLSGPLEESIASALGPGQQALAAELTQVVNRLLVWSLQVSKDARRGDRIDILFSPAPPGGSGPTRSMEPVVEAVRYESQKFGKTFAAYRYAPPGARWPRYWRADGSSVEEQLVDGPIADYEQITSLVRDGRRHKGVDFRAPVGTPVHAPFDGTIVRRNWKFSANGNCLDLVDAAGRHAIFLHLDVLPKGMQPGTRVRKGEEIATSGNSGHSTAPHLHYQLEDSGGKVLDPFKVHRATRTSIPAADRAAFDAERARLDARMAAGR